MSVHKRRVALANDYAPRWDVYSATPFSTSSGVQGCRNAEMPGPSGHISLAPRNSRRTTLGKYRTAPDIRATSS